jgi:hypothetical protein
MASSNELRDRVLKKVLATAKKNNTALYSSKEHAFLKDRDSTWDSNSDTVKTLAEIIEHYEIWNCAPLTVKGNFINDLIETCLKSNENELAWFARNSIALIKEGYNDRLNVIIRKNLDKPDALLQFIVQSPKTQHKMYSHELPETINLMMNHLPQPQGKEALIAYLLAHQSEMTDKHMGMNDDREEHFRTTIIESLKFHAKNHMKDFEVLDFIQKYNNNQTLILNDDNLLPPLRLNMDYQNIRDYLGISELTVSNTKLWMETTFMYGLRWSKDNGNDFLAIDSVDSKDKTENKATFYVNVRQGSTLTQAGLEKSIQDVLDYLKSHHPANRDEMDLLTKNFHQTYWLMEKIQNSVDKTCPEADGEETPRMSLKI